ncbi:MAG TPA: DUF1232 domain-containing protein [Actinomycetota bacterium]|nr:DUF1232 domain-containing protein [Actinomycetota bacterium]
MVRWLIVAGAVVVGVWVLLVIGLTLAGRRSAARELVTLVPNLVRLFNGLVRDPRVPRRSKALLALGAIWLASPIDLIPEFIPVLGPLDDAVVAALILRYLVRTAGPEVIAAHWAGDPATLARIVRLSGSTR